MDDSRHLQIDQYRSHRSELDWTGCGQRCRHVLTPSGGHLIGIVLRYYHGDWVGRLMSLDTFALMIQQRRARTKDEADGS